MSAWINPWMGAYQLKSSQTPPTPFPPLIGDGTPVYLRILICSNGEPVKGSPFLLKWKRRGVYINFGNGCERS